MIAPSILRGCWDAGEGADTFFDLTKLGAVLSLRLAAWATPELAQPGFGVYAAVLAVEGLATLVHPRGGCLNAFEAPEFPLLPAPLCLRGLWGGWQFSADSVQVKQEAP